MGHQLKRRSSSCLQQIGWVSNPNRKEKITNKQINKGGWENNMSPTSKTNLSRKNRRVGKKMAKRGIRARSRTSG